MASYLPNRKQVDAWICEWEKLFMKSEQTCSMSMFVANNVVAELLQKLLDNGYDEKVAKETLKRLLGNG